MNKSFLKWVGGKRKLIKQYEELGLIPSEFQNYYEPFLGGGAMFFYLSEKGLINSAVLSDLNEELINTYIQIKNYLPSLKTKVRFLSKIHSQEQYEHYKNLRLDNDSIRAARFIYLNKACRSGIWRVNKAGKFNVPMGDLTQKIYQPELLDNASFLLNKAQTSILVRDGIETLDTMHSGDFAFIDPPYHNTFTLYNAKTFDENYQIKLSIACKNLVNRGCKLLICNSDTELIRDLYKDFEFDIYGVYRSGNINSDLGKRQKVKELIIKGGY